MVLIKNTFSKIIIGMVLIIALSNVVNAQDFDLITPEEVNLDISKTRIDDNYSLPTRIVITPVHSETEIAGLDADEMYRGIYFYTVEMLGFNDIPYHYLVSEDGELYKGNQGGDERRLRISGIGDNVVLIGYMTSKSSARFTTEAKDSLKNLVTNISNVNGINPLERVEVTGVKFNRDVESRTVTLEKKDLFGTWQTDLTEITNFASLQYNPQGRTYQIAVNNVIIPDSEVTPGTEVVVSLDISNLGQFGIYGGTENELLLTKVGEGSSAFFLNNEWVSTTQVPIMSEDEYLLPFNNSIYDVRVKAPIFVGQITETFEIFTISGQKINTEPITITLNIARTDRPIVQIQNTETGVLNVRSEPSSVAQSFTQVSAGQRFFKVGDAGNGWIQIELEDGSRGWIASWYAQEI